MRTDPGRAAWAVDGIRMATGLLVALLVALLAL